MYLKYVKKDVNAEKEGVLEVGKFYKVLSCTDTTFKILDDADKEIEIPMLNMGIAPDGTRVKLVNDVAPAGCKGDTGKIKSTIKSIVSYKKAPSISYFFIPDKNTEECYLCDREDFEIVL